MKWLDELIRKTDCYKRLYRELGVCKSEHTKLEFMYNEQHKHLLQFTQEIEKNKKVARKIVRLTNSLLKKDELVPTKKEIQALCHEITRGEK